MKKFSLTILCIFIPLCLFAESSGKITIKREQMQTMLSNAILEQSPWKGRAEIIIKNIKVPDSITIPDICGRKSKVVFSKREDFLGFVTATLVFGESQNNRVSVNASVQVKANVPVAKTNLRRGNIIGADDVEMRTMDISRFPLVVTKIEECEGMRLKSSIRKNSPIVLTKIDVPPLVLRGEPVLIEANIDNLLITDKGIAMVDGRKDQRIPVKNTRSGKSIVATVVAPSKVRVDF